MIILLSLTILSFCFSLQPHDFNIASIHDIIKIHPEIKYIKCHDVEPFEYKPFPISQFPELQPNKGLLAETFVLKIPNGQVCSWCGWIKVDNNIILDFFPPYFSLDFQVRSINKALFKNIKKITGKVAVLTIQQDACYFHWIYNILSRLALLEKEKIEYDWLFVACDKPYMKESLALWGVDPAKIIQPFRDMIYIEADELIVPSHMGVRTPEPHEYYLDWTPLEIYCKKWNLDPKNTTSFISAQSSSCIVSQNVSIENIHARWAILCSMYYQPCILDYLQNKFLSCLNLKQKNNLFSRKVFISRKDATIRNMINEDEIFQLFEQKGFVRYNLAMLSVLEQIELFNNADIIVAAHGAALTNILFCKPKTHIIEIFQARSECCFYNLSQNLNLSHHCIKTMDFDNIDGQFSTSIDQDIIQNFITENKELFVFNK